MSLSHRAIKDLRALRLKKYRLAEARCLIEGARLVDEALRSRAVVEQVLVTEAFAKSSYWSAMRVILQGRGLEAVSLTDVQAQQLGDTRHPQGIFTVVRISDHYREPPPTLVPPLLILDDIADPGNLGTILRTADWFGIPSVWTSLGSTDLFNPKVVRGGMGAHFHIPGLWQGDINKMAGEISVARVLLLGAAMDGQSLHEMDAVGENWALVIGNEAHGLSPFWRKRLDRSVTIPGRGRVESLNAAVAAGIILHYLLS